MKEASTKAEKLFIMHSAKQIGKIKDAEERERQAKDLEKKAKKMGLDRADIEKILDDQGAYGEEYSRNKTREEAENMHKYVNTLSLGYVDSMLFCKVYHYLHHIFSSTS